MRNVLLLVLCCSLPQLAWAKIEIPCEEAAERAAVFMQMSQEGKKTKWDMYKTVRGVWPNKVKFFYREIIDDARGQETIKSPTVMKFSVTSFQEKWYKICLDRNEFK